MGERIVNVMGMDGSGFAVLEKVFWFVVVVAGVAILGIGVLIGRCCM